MIDIEIPSAPPFKNRRPGLIGCGIVHLLLGLLLFLMCALILVSLTMMPEGAQSPTPVNVVVYACLLTSHWPRSLPRSASGRFWGGGGRGR